ncbi:ribonuclease E/G [Vannielia litorea]|uniref:ribonuclease E/G n=1 Tax=Vannielia litorea TaxID=1217970 RepID=UPI001C95A4A6|nr:ribonuclease E/G [Vannielia litorea]MBY6153909.1 ribonuclease E/G [Vannielia litorea]
MKGTQIILDHVAGREAAARMVDGRLDDLLIDAPGILRPGAIWRAKAERQAKGQGGIFLAAGDQRFWFRQAKGVAPGEALVVQVTSYAEVEKAPPVTRALTFKSRYVIVTPDAPGVNVARSIRDDDERDRLKLAALEALDGRDWGLILRSSCMGAEEAAISEDIATMIDTAEAALSEGEVGEIHPGDGPHITAWREWTTPAEVITEPGGFETHGVLDALAELQGPRERAGEATLYVEPTRALVAVDVNTGGDMSPAAALKANIAAAKALPRALRLRGLGGRVVVDFAPMPKGQRKQLEQSLKAAFRADPIETVLAGWTPLGQYEMQRKRERLPLSLTLPEEAL